MLNNKFPEKTVNYLEELAANNQRQWFEDNRFRYENDLLEPAKSLVLDLGEKLAGIRPGLNAIPKIDKSIFRIYRDVRFSKDKSPYKSHLGIFFWEGARKKMECSGLYFHLEPGYFMIAIGMHTLPPPLLKKFRDVVSRPKKAAEVSKIVSGLAADKRLIVAGKHYKKFPRGYDSDFVDNEFLLYNGLYAYYSETDLSKIRGEKVVTLAVDIFNNVLPLHNWLV